MSSSDFPILRQLYTFLSDFGPDDIDAAARRQAVPENIRIALEALAREARANGGRKAPTSFSKSTRARRKVPADVSVKTALKSFLLNKKTFPDKATLAQFAMDVGAPEAASSKYSRERVAHHIAQRAARDETFRRRLNEMIESLAVIDPQSRGWMDLILRK